MTKTAMLLFWLFVCFSLPEASGQTAGADSASHLSPSGFAISQYHRAMGPQGHIYAGSEYVGNNMPSKGHPYFLTNQWEEASIHYDGLLYHHIPLLYDVVHDHLLTSHSDETGLFLKIKLNKEKISSFTVSGNMFVRLAGDTASATPLPAGLYHRLYDGKVAVLAKRQKKIKQEIEGQVAAVSFVSKDLYYIRKDNQYFPVKNRAAVMRVFQDQKKELARHLRKSGIAFGQNRELAIITLAEKYDALKN